MPGVECKLRINHLRLREAECNVIHWNRSVLKAIVKLEENDVAVTNHQCNHQSPWMILMDIWLQYVNDA